MCKKIAVFDSGIGGVTILKEIVALLPYEEVIYFSDGAHCPYGGRSKQEIIELSVSVVEFLRQQEIKLVVVACNTATTNAIKELRDKFEDIIFVGTEPAVKPAFEQSKSGIVAVMATESTIESNQVMRLKGLYGEGKSLYELSGKGLVEIVEQGMENTEECRSLLTSYIEPLIGKGVDIIVLGCTHYPFLTPIMEEIIGDRGVKVIDSAKAVARRVKSQLEEYSLLSSSEKTKEVTILSSLNDSEYIEMINERFKQLKYKI